MTASSLQCRRFGRPFTEAQWHNLADHLEFSRREIEIVRLVFEEARDQAIADELSISVNTVQTHLKRLYSKLGVVNRVGMVLRIVREHLADSMDARHHERIVLLEPGARRAA
jgi:DNA-binding CsgD family transcriptional regulator